MIYRLIFTSIFLIGLTTQADILRCSGDISFWAQEKNKWVQVKLKKNEIYETNHNQTQVIKIGEYLKFPALVIYPFFGIETQIINKKVKYESDEKSYLKLTYEKKHLVCDVKNEAAF